MSKKFLGRMIAGAALGGTSLLVFSPSAALADGGHHSEGYQKDSSGHAFAKPAAVRPGGTVELVEVCTEAQQHAWLWSRVTGKVDLIPRDDHRAGKKPEESRAEKPDEGKTKKPDEGKAGKTDEGKTKKPEESKAEKPDEGKAEGTGGMARDDGGHGWAEYGKAEDGRHGWEKAEPRSDGGEADRKAEPGKDSWEKAEPGKDGWESGGGKAEDGWTGGKGGYEYWNSVTVPWDAKPGSYELTGSCGKGELTILPKGWVDGGDGGVSSGNGDNLAVAGMGVLGLAGLGGLVLLRQRRTDESAD
ncbi:hypothetical protein O7626_27045 [Micromonospora sp. WMMD1102]|uniref:hypothetical protein n=1 Tax=Micromonospora sp. WMMD1102 TaxID=3016105 RepID=UPI0024158A20|nr:hypothetical protein [Micromonospora sp. WMMD1102]MDG4789536.1 hypothetical protein [Micromonospora sp. WMMD1102]